MAENYCTLAEVKASLDITDEASDALIEQAIGAGSRAIEQITGRFYYATSATRYFRRPNIQGKVLLLDDDLLSVTTLTNGNGVAIQSADYWLLPRNETRKRAIELKSTKFWDLSTADAEISVQGSWGASTTPPDNVRSAAVLIAARLYRRKDSVFGIVGGTDVASAVYIAKNDPDVRFLLAFELAKPGLW